MNQAYIMFVWLEPGINTPRVTKKAEMIVSVTVSHANFIGFNYIICIKKNH